jgi:hypothetical protein
MIRIHSAARPTRAAILSVAIASAATAGLLASGAAAHASDNQSRGLVTVTTCGAIAGKVSYSPGLLTSTAQNTTATLKANVSNCTTEGDGHLASFGSITVDMTGSASLNAENFSGTFTIHWPSPFTEASTGTLGVYDSSGTEEVSGTFTSGPYTGDELNFYYQATGRSGKGTSADPVTSQNVIDTTSLAVVANNG